MISVIIEIIERDEDRMTISLNLSLSFATEIKKYPVAENIIFKMNRLNIYL